MSNITSANTYLSLPCERCGSKKKVGKKWKEKIPTFSGFTTVEYTQMICTNKKCQADFDKLMIEEAKKRETVRVKKEENRVANKANLLLSRTKRIKASV